VQFSESQSKVLAADEARYQALYAQDVQALERMLTEDYAHTHANGHVDDKAGFLASIKAAKYRFVNAERSEQKVRAAGPVFVLNGTTKTTLDVGGEIRVMNNAFVTVWVQKDDGLKLLHWQATKIV
jgi:ketosteroid isomerase-like protein